IIQAGGLSGYFKTGWTVNVEDGSANLSRGNSESACTVDTSTMINGVSQATGTPPTAGNAPINKYYCNLMNALGVKAGADGFPLKDGTAEVVRFGMYDKTEDFIGGGTNPPLIHDPGGFEALKANG
ncbi:MAG TPA: Tat pathway signal sequence, partial [Polyangiaceae bacterium]|nr:Tat pathway signal sequence [Polyangiaceae bacterium]